MKHSLTSHIIKTVCFPKQTYQSVREKETNGNFNYHNHYCHACVFLWRLWWSSIIINIILEEVVIGKGGGKEVIAIIIITVVEVVAILLYK